MRDTFSSNLKASVRGEQDDKRRASKARGLAAANPETMRCPGNVSLDRRPPIKLLAESYRIELREPDTAFGRVVDTDLLGNIDVTLDEGDRSYTFTEVGRYVLNWEVERR